MEQKQQVTTQPLSIEYDDTVLFGTRGKITGLIKESKLGNESNCVLFAVGAFTDKKQWNLRDLIGLDRRLGAMTEGLNLKSAMPVQGYCWPKMKSSLFPILCISPQGTGKTFAHLLYIVSTCIESVSVNTTDYMISGQNEHVYKPVDCIEPDELITQPEYIIVSSSQHQAEQLVRHVSLMKEKAYGSASEMRCLTLPPIVKSVSVNHDDEKLALRCCHSGILIAPPNALLKCYQARYINFSRCKMIVFDDLDLALQLHNADIFLMFKIYFSEILKLEKPINSEATSHPTTSCQGQQSSPFFFFSRKWTDLVRNFVETVSLQRVILFGSIAEASIYTKLQFELEPFTSQSSKFDKLVQLLKLSTNNYGEQRAKLAIVCATDTEATDLSQKLQSLEFNTRLIVQNHVDQNGGKPHVRQRISVDTIPVISDGAIGVEVDVSSSRKPLNTISHIVHYSMPSDMLKFDSRFRLMYKNIQNNERDLLATIFIGPNFNSKHAKQLFDLLSRSTTTLTGTKLILKDYLGSNDDPICWRWATTGSCRLEKLSRGDKFGTYCFDKHQVNEKSKMNRFPTSGQVKITLTHMISPSEFFFRFEAHRDMDNIHWKQIDSSGSDFMRDLQKQLDDLRDVHLRSVPLAKIIKGKVYAVYFQDETRVDRVLLLDEPKHEQENVATDSAYNGFSRSRISRVNEELEFTKRVRVVKIDYGSKLEIFIKNLIELPPSLASIPAQCHRGFHVGFKPANNEPFWLYKAKKGFFDSVYGNDVTVWLRLNSDNCFWFEHMQVTRRQLIGDLGESPPEDPYKNLCSTGFAEPVCTMPGCLLSSVRNQTIARWHSEHINNFARQAFVDFEAAFHDLFILDIKEDLTVVVRQSKFNKQLIELEDDLLEEYAAGALPKQHHLAKKILCLVKVLMGNDPVTNRPIYALNRARLIEAQEQQQMDLDSPNNIAERMYKVYCLDHGVHENVQANQVYRMSKEHLMRIPFQAIEFKLGNVHPRLLVDKSLNRHVRNLIIDETRNMDNVMYIVRCRFDTNKHLYLYLRDKEKYRPLTRIMEISHGIRIHEVAGTEYENGLIHHDEESSNELNQQIVEKLIALIMGDVIKEEMASAGLECKRLIGSTDLN